MMNVMTRACRIAVPLAMMTLLAGVVRAERPAPTLERGFSDVAKKAIPAVVFINVEKSIDVDAPGASPHGYGFNDPYEYFGDDFLRRFFGYGVPGHPVPRHYLQRGQGSGFIISEDGYILTNNHVVGDVDDIIVTLHDGTQLKARLVGTDPHSEVAVIKVDGEHLPYIPLGDSSNLDIGDWVIAVGNPFGLSATLTVGVVSAKGRDIGLTDEHDAYGHVISEGYESFIQTDAAINPGNSGGPLLNTAGEAVGINTAIFSQSGGYMGIGFAIPMNMARDIKDQLIDHGSVERGYIGIYIQDMNRDLAAHFDMQDPEGILIAGVGQGTAGAAAGLNEGDIILSMNGTPVESASSFRNKVASTRPGTTLDLGILRDGRDMDLAVKIGSLDGESASVAPEAASSPSNRIGLSVEELTPELARQLGYDGRGVVVSQVDDGSPAERAGIQPGQVVTSVNRRAVQSVDDYEKALLESEDTGTVLLLVSGGRGSRFVALSVE